MRILFGMEFLAFTIVGLLAGASISSVIQYREREASIHATSIMLLSMPVSALSHIDTRI